MAKKWQHYVPRVYTKAWETTVVSKKEPNKAFKGVYYYEKSDLSTGDGRNTESILATNHTYTIDFKYIFIFSQCPEIRNEFSNTIKDLLKERSVNAFYNGKLLTNRNAISSSLSDLDNWDFYNLNGTQAPKRTNINAIKEVRSYCLEDKFSSYVENRWEKVLKEFLAPFPTVDGRGQFNYSFSNTQSVINMLEMLTLMMCRNPKFDLLSFFPWIKDQILIPVYSQVGNVAEANVMMRGIWLAEIYKGLFGGSGFSKSFIDSAASGLGIVLFRVANDSEGSFITSDNPVVYYKLLVESSNSNGIYFPLTPQFTLFLGRRSDEQINSVVFRTVCNQDIRRINRIILNTAETSIVSTEQHLGYILF